jgi:hypothetical protein
MMNPSPSTPPGHANGGGTRQRQRIGGDLPYRDDPVSESKLIALCSVSFRFVSLREEMAGKYDDIFAGTVEEDGV